MDDSKFKFFSKQAGLSLLELMITTGISALMIVFINAQFSNFYQIFGNVKIDAEIQEISAFLSKAVDCDKTLKGIDINKISEVQLLDKNGKPILKNHSLGGIAQPYKMITHNWVAKVIWTGQSLEVRLAKVNPHSISWAKDPVTLETLDFNSARTTIFTNPPNGIPLCPRSSYQSVLEERLSTTSGVINPLVDLPATDRIGPILSMPILGHKACHKFCRNEGYTAGRLLSVSDTYASYDDDGAFIDTDYYDSGESRVNCGCFR